MNGLFYKRLRLNGFYTISVGILLGIAVRSALVSAHGQTLTRLPTPPPHASGFTLIDPSSSGLRFTNVLQGDLAWTNAVTHNGSGVALGDVDRDGRVDIYLCSLQGPNRLYRNLGNWRFAESALGVAACAGQRSTGAAFADVDGDGDLDLLVNGIAAGTRLFLNDGHGGWTEKMSSGLSRSNSPTSLALADLDGDGDLDLFCATYTDQLFLADPTTRVIVGQKDGRPAVTSVNGQSAELPPWRDRFEVGADGQIRELAEVDCLYRNEGSGTFAPIHLQSGVFLTPDGRPMPPLRELGLGVCFRDLNHDGLPDLYVCNDTGHSDRLWLNQGNATFRLADPYSLRHGSHSSMGIDVADVNRDGRDDILVVDMLAEHPARRLQNSRPNDPYQTLRESASPHRTPLFNRNTLYLGRPNGAFVEAALYAGVAASDWSWCPLFLDVDLDGYEDLLVTNGFEQNVLDADSIAAIGRRKWTPEEMKRYRRIHPRWNSVTAAFRNRGNGTFEQARSRWGFEQSGVVNGMAMADLDNDGDLDLVMNCLNAPARLYRNESDAPRIQVQLRGLPPNTEGIGARIVVTGGDVPQSQEVIAGGRYLSSDQAVRVFAANSKSGSNSALQVEVQWRSGRRTIVSNVPPFNVVTIHETPSQPFPAVRTHSPPTYFEDISTRLAYAHGENDFDDWATQPLLPYALSRTGPPLAWHDFDGDGWEDLVVGPSRGNPVVVLNNQAGKTFQRLESPIASPSDTTAVVEWHDGRGNGNLIFAESNTELPPNEFSHLLVVQPTTQKRLPAGPSGLGSLSVADVDGDGDLDLFAGGRPVPGRFPEPGKSTLWINEHGALKLDAASSQRFASIGRVQGSVFADFDGDGLVDLAIAEEWGPIHVFRNNRGQWIDATRDWGFESHTGLWNGIAAGDFDGDGRLDLVAGNVGRNSVYELTLPPARLYFGDWSGIGAIQILEAWTDGAQWRPMRDRFWLARGLAGLEQKFPTHEKFSAASVPDILGDHWTSSTWVEAAEWESAVFLNRGPGRPFERRSLPTEAQWSSGISPHVADFDGDGRDDLFMSQNRSGSSWNLTRDDAGDGLWLRGNGDGSFEAIDAAKSGIRILGEQRGAALADFNHDGRVDLAVGQNGGPLRLFLNQRGAPGLRVILQGPSANPNGVGAVLRVHYAGRGPGPLRAIQSGSGFGCQDSTIQVLGLAAEPKEVWVRWPGGREQTASLRPGQREIQIKALP